MLLPGQALQKTSSFFYYILAYQSIGNLAKLYYIKKILKTHSLNVKQLVIHSLFPPLKKIIGVS